MPAVTPWYTGAQVPLTWINTDTTGTPQDASSLPSVTVTVTQPDGTTATPSVTRVTTGSYKAVFTTTQAGHHTFTWVSTDATYPGSFGDSFEVQPLPDGTIVSLAEAKEILKLTSTTSQDAIIQGHNAAATDVIEYYCGPVVQKTITETLPSRGAEVMLSKPPVLALLPWTVLPAQLAADGIVLPVPASPMLRTRTYGIEWPLTQLYVDTERGVVTHVAGLPFFYCAYLWQYSAGRLVIPPSLYDAAKIILLHLYGAERGGQAGGTQAAYGRSETTMTPMGFAIPNRAFELMRPSMAASSMVAV